MAEQEMTGVTDAALPGDGGYAGRRWVPLWFVAAAAAASAGLVAVGAFGWGLPDGTHVQSYHPDEQNTTYSLRNMRPKELDFNPRFFGNPTFYTYQVGALALAASSTGWVPREMSEDFWLAHPQAVRRFYILGRSLSFVYALLSVYFVYAVTRRVGGHRQAALLAAAAFAALPVTAVHSHYMTVNAASVFWCLVAAFFAVGIINRPSWKNYILAGVFGGLAISTKMNNLFVPLAVFAAHLAVPGGARWWRRLLVGKLWAAWGLAAAAFFAGSPYYLLAYDTVKNDPHNKMNMAALFGFSAPASVVLKDFWNHVTAACGWGLAILFLFALAVALAARLRRLAPVLAVAVPFLLVAVKSGWWAFPSRLWPLLAFMAIVTGTLLARAKGAARAALGVALGAALLAAIPWNVAYYSLARAPHIRAESSRWIEANVPAGSRLIILQTPYFEDPDIVYENALHPRYVSGPKYEIVDLRGNFGALSGTPGEWLVVPEYLGSALKAKTGKGIRDYAAAGGFRMEKEFQRTFEAFGWQLRTWIPADMIQDYPVLIFARRASAP